MRDRDLGTLRHQHPDGNLQSPPGWIHDTDRPISSLRSAKNPQGNTMKRVKAVEDLNICIIGAQGIVGVGARRAAGSRCGGQRARRRCRQRIPAGREAIPPDYALSRTSPRLVSPSTPATAFRPPMLAAPSLASTAAGTGTSSTAIRSYSCRLRTAVLTERRRILSPDFSERGPADPRPPRRCGHR